MDQHWEYKIEAILEWLGLLKITKKDILEETTEYTNNMLMVPALATVYNEQTGLLKSIVPDLDGSMEIEQSLKTGGEGSNYFSRVTELIEQITESPQYLSNLERA